jgi:hypothetical protein
VLHGVPIFHLMLLGAEGPFGELHKMDSEKDYMYHLLDQSVLTGFYHNGNGWQGPSAWCLFVYDTILSLNGKSLLKSGLGSQYLGLYCHYNNVRTNTVGWTSKNEESEITNSLYYLLHVEMSIQWGHWYSG